MNEKKGVYYLDKVRRNDAKELDIIITSIAAARERRSDPAALQEWFKFVVPFFERYRKKWRTLDRTSPGWEKSSREFLLAVRELAGFMGFDSNFKGRSDWGKCALEVAEVLGDRESIVELCASTISWAALQLGNFVEARNFARRGYDEAIAVGDYRHAALAARTLSGVARDICGESQGRDVTARREAVKFASIAFRSARACANDDLRYSAVFDLSNAAMLGTHWRRAEKGYRVLVQHFEDGLAGGNEHNEPVALIERVASRYGDLAICLICQGRVEEALTYMQKSASLFERLDSEIMRAESSFNAAAAARLDGDGPLAQILERRGEEKFKELGITRLPRVKQYLQIAALKAGKALPEIRKHDLLTPSAAISR